MSPTKKTGAAKPAAAADEADTDEATTAAADDEAGTETDGDSELSEDELRERDALDVKRLDVALALLDDESLRNGLAGLTEKQRQELAVTLNLPRATVHLGEGLAPLVRRKLRGLSIDRQHAIASSLTQRANDATVELLGDRSEDPSRADLDEVLPGIVEEYGLPLVRLMLASYGISDAPVRDVMRELLDSDERFALPDEAPADDTGDAELPSFGLVPRRAKADADPARAEVLEKRKAAKAERRAAATRERAARQAAQASRREALHASKHRPGS